MVQDTDKDMICTQKQLFADVLRLKVYIMISMHMYELQICTSVP